MIYSGESIQVERREEEGLAHLVFNAKNGPVNKFDRQTLEELGEAIACLQAEPDCRGLLLTSAKDAFIVGADITEFLTLFRADESDLIDNLMRTNRLFSDLEDLPFPTVAAIDGLALGGGLEVALACDFRVLSERAKVGLPEVKLGIYPGFGGTVRLSRLVGADNAIEWICTGNERRPDEARKIGVADALTTPEKLEEAALDLLRRAATGEIDYAHRRAEKTGPLALNNIESMMVFETSKGYVASQAGKNYPAPVEAVKTLQKHAGLARDEAIKVEVRNFAKLARGPVAENLISLFLNDQALKKKAREWEAEALPVNTAAVLGAGIMGGGIAYQSASKGVPIYMRDIAEEGLKAGLDEAAKLLRKQIDRKKINLETMGNVLNSIRPVLSLGDFKQVDLAVEAVVENPEIKKTVLAEVEKALPEQAVMASNTSTISINTLAQSLADPSRFCGMHFFNPVHRMPLVEVIRSKYSSESTIATVVTYAKQLGKSPIVVNDCPGFYVNRVLFPYFAGFAMLVRDGADYRTLDRTMEGFGWPMGPAYLLDVVGLDTAVHAQAVMAEGFPERMAQSFTSAMHRLHDEGRKGQKNGLGFYRYEIDKKGKPKKLEDDRAMELVRSVAEGSLEPSADAIIDRMMLPMCIEVARCLEEDIVSSPEDADMGLIYGLGFPPFRGGVLKYMDDVGLARIVEKADALSHLGPLYEVTQGMRAMASQSETYYQR